MGSHQRGPYYLYPGVTAIMENDQRSQKRAFPGLIRPSYRRRRHRRRRIRTLAVRQGN